MGISLEPTNNLRKIEEGLQWKTIKRINNKKKQEEAACDALLELKGEKSKSLLFDAYILAKDLKKLRTKRMWKIMSQVWVELLCYAAKSLQAKCLCPASQKRGDRSKSILFDACLLAKELNKLESEFKWQIMSKVWVELLAYAATHCGIHAQQLSKGGELTTFVWLLVAHFGLGEQFRVEAGHARAKLVVGNS
ncbi:unnamed protein product [Camellia sinensis]